MAMKRALLLSVLVGLLMLGCFTGAEAQVIAQRAVRQSITTAGADCTTATSCVVIPDVYRTSNGLFDISGTWTGTLQFEGSVDCSTWRSIAATPLSGTPNAVTSTTATGTWSYSAPLCGVRVRASTLSSGTAIVTINAISAGGGGFGGGAASTVSQGTSPWVTSLTPADTTTGSTALGALNDAISVPLTGQVGFVFQLSSAGTGVYTVTPECSFDGGTLYPISTPVTDASTGLASVTTTISSGQATSVYTGACGFGASHARLRVSTYTSGTANWVARATSGGFPTAIPTLYNTAPTVSAANTAATITVTGAAGQRVCVYDIVIYATGATGSAAVTIQDGATVIKDLGIVALGALNTAVNPCPNCVGPVVCGSTGNNVVINVGAGGASVVTNTSVTADRG